jgi:hypothetical protein
LADKKSIVTNSGETETGAKFVVKKDLEPIIKQQSNIQKLFDKFRSFPLVSQSRSDDIIDDLDDRINSHTYSYINKLKASTGDDITQFLNKTLRNTSTTSNYMMGINTAEDLFNNDSNNFSAFFFERYKNINNKYEDLRIITEYLYELTEAVNTMRDSIVGADDLVSMVSRELIFGNRDDENKEGIESNINYSTVEELENKYQTKKRISNMIVPGALTYGNFFVYTIPYKDVFAQFEWKRKIDIRKGIYNESTTTVNPFLHPVFESAIGPKPSYAQPFHNKPQATYKPVIESITTKYNSWLEAVSEPGEVVKKASQKEIADSIDQILEGIEICNDANIPFMEDTSILTLADINVRDEALKAYRKASRPDANFTPYWNRDRATTDGIVDMGEPDKASVDEYKDVSGVFVKLYEPTQVIPVYVMDACVGYYALYDTFGELRNTILLNSSLNRSNIAFASTKRKELDDEVIGVIADAICQSVDKKYVAANPQFKDLIVNAISYREFYKRKFRVQFIPENYMTHFKINEDPDNHQGVSVLNKSLFYAKLYLSLLLFKIITILTKSNDMRVYYIKNAGINKNMVNRVQEIARAIKDKQISFNDLASIQTIFSKVGNYKEAFIPMGKSGEKAIEAEILSGQSVELNNDLMELLRKGMITNTGVPSAIINAFDEVDFSRTLVMQHTKYMARVISMQTELEAAVTEWYRKLMAMDSGISEQVIQNFQFRFTRPRSLNTQNLVDMLGNTETLADFIVKMEVPDENNSELIAKVKQKVIKNVLLHGVINWKEYDELFNDAVNELHKEKLKKNIVGDGTT